MTKVLALAIDAEFTSFDMIGGDLITFGVTLVLDDLTLGASFYGEVRPRSTKYFTAKAQEVHGISYFKASQFPSSKETILRFMNWLMPIIGEFPLRTIYWGSWNFDLKWIENTFERAGCSSSFKKAFNLNKDSHINAFKLAKEKLKHINDNFVIDQNGKEVNKKYSLDNVARFYGYEFNHHNAMDDAKTTAKVFIDLMNEKNTWTGKLI